jgi:hypothetical protein
MMASINHLSATPIGLPIIPFTSYPGENCNKDSTLSIKFKNNSQIKSGIRWLNASWSTLARMRKRGNL